MAAAEEAPTPPELIDDVIVEILARIPPDESAYLVRASLVCKLWRRIILSDAADFPRRYRELHRTPPLLGFLHNSDSRRLRRLFFPVPASATMTTMAAEASCSASAFDVYCNRLWWSDLDYRGMWALDCRHGRVLLRHREKFLVWDPITGAQAELPKPPNMPVVFFSASMVLCARAAAGGCDHCDCLGGPFLIVFVMIDDGRAHACVYSSESRAWSKPVSVYMGGESHLVDMKRAALVGHDAYFSVRDGATILKYDLEKNCLSAIDPPRGYRWNIIIMPITRDDDDGSSSLGLAGIWGFSSLLHLWVRKVNNNPNNGVARWVQCRAMELDKLLPINISGTIARVIGFAEGVGVIFVRVDTSIFMIELKSGWVRNVRDSAEFYNVLPFMSFYTPGSASSILPTPTEKK